MDRLQRKNIGEIEGLNQRGGRTLSFVDLIRAGTMTPEMVADAARMIKPAILYPYHTTDTDVSRLQPLLKEEKGIEIRIRRMP